MDVQYHINDEYINLLELRQNYASIIRKTIIKLKDMYISECREEILNDESVYKSHATEIDKKITDLIEKDMETIIMESFKVPNTNWTLFNSFERLHKHLISNGKEIKNVIIFYLPKTKNYIYFSSKEQCIQFINTYEESQLIEIVPDSSQQNISLIFGLKDDDKDSTIAKIINSLFSSLKDKFNNPLISLTKDESSKTIWIHIVNQYCNNFGEMVAKTYSVIEEFDERLKFPELMLQGKLGISVWEKMITNKKMLIEGNTLKEEKMENTEKMAIICPIFNNIVNNYNVHNNINGNNNVVKNENQQKQVSKEDTVKSWVQKNPPGVDESCHDYHRRYSANTDKKIHIGDFGNYVQSSGYAKFRKHGKTSQTWKKT